LIFKQIIVEERWTILLVETKYLVEGCIIAKDIQGLTNRPIMNKQTILDAELLNVLEGFLIEEVSVENTLINGERFLPKEIIDPELSEERKGESRFISHYLKAVQAYKRLFTNWQAGSKVAVDKVREIMIPLFQKAIESPSDLLVLHHYCHKEEYLYHHAVSLGLLSGFIARKMKYHEADVYQVVMAGCLADCGMAKIPSSILNKNAKLTFEENEEIYKHPLYSYQLIQSSVILKDAVKIAILEHHERINGSGYPKRKRKEDIHVFSRMIAVADVYHAMTSERIYRKKQSPFKVMEMIMHDDFGKFDIAIVKILLASLINFSIGNRVRLNDGSVAEIIFMDDNSPTRPLVKVINSQEIINLSKVRDLYIEEIL
jgi:HD-GYP domain-containing protein (c-di-GMP phosphodiesterase class II)